MIAHVIATLRPQVDALVVVGRDHPGEISIGDRPAPGLGPLGGLCAALHYAAAHGFATVVTSGCDLPDLPRDLVERLGVGPAVAEGQPLLGIWPSTLAPALDEQLSRGERSMRSWASAAGARSVDVGKVRNINRVEDLAETRDAN